MLEADLVDLDAVRVQRYLEDVAREVEAKLVSLGMQPAEIALCADRIGGEILESLISQGHTEAVFSIPEE